MALKTKTEFHPLTTTLDVQITEWNEIPFSKFIEETSGSYYYAQGLSVSLYLILDRKRLQVCIRRTGTNSSNSIHCKLCLMGQLEQKLYEEEKIVTFPPLCGEVPFTEWWLEGVKKVVPTRDPLTIRCTFSILRGDTVFNGSMHTETTSLIVTGTKNNHSQSHTSDLSKDFATLLQNQTLSDIVLKVGQESFRAHKLILSSRSRVFYAMLKHDMEERNSNSISIDDIKPAIFKILLQYIYTGNVPEIPSENVYAVYSAADKYAVFGLKKMCAIQMLSILSEDNIYSSLEIGDRHADQFLLDGVISFMLAHDNVFLSDPWQEFCQNNLSLAVEIYSKFAAAKLNECPIKSKEPIAG